MRFTRFAKGQRPYKRVKGRMTKLEATYADTLRARMIAREIEWYDFEKVTLKLADDTRYTPDFVVMTGDGSLEFHECKGFMEEAAFVRLKIAAAMFPFRFFLVQKAAAKDGGGMTVKEVVPEPSGVTS